jgi:hypothetical protein
MPNRKRTNVPARKPVVIPHDPRHDAHADRIRWCCSRCFEEAIEMGERLFKCRTILKNKRVWLAWLKREFQWSRDAPPEITGLPARVRFHAPPHQKMTRRRTRPTRLTPARFPPRRAKTHQRPPLSQHGASYGHPQGASGGGRGRQTKAPPGLAGLGGSCLLP